MDATEKFCIEFAQLPRVISIQVAARLPAWINADDLEPAAWEGLFIAAKTFDPNKGYSAKRWAWQRIELKIIDDVRKESLVARTMQLRIKELKDANHRLSMQFGREPTNIELADELKVPLKHVEATLLARAAGAPLSIDVEIHDPVAPSQTRYSFHERHAKALDEALGSLTERQARIMHDIYWRGITRDKIAQALGVSGSRISQIHTQSLRILREGIMRTSV